MPPIHRPAIAGLAALLLAAIVGGCSAAPSPSGARGTSRPAASSVATASSAPAGPTATTVAQPPPRPDDCVTGTLASLSEEQRIGQLFMVGLRKDRVDQALRNAVTTSHFGSVAFTTQTAAGVEAVRAIADDVQGMVTDASTRGVGFMIAANQEGGRIQGLSGPGFDTIPTARAQGRWTPAKLEGKAADWGSQLLNAGINLDLAPVADVVPPGTDAQNAPIGKLKRAFGHDPATVSSHVGAFIAGMQRAGVATTAKHFPGLGRVVGNTDFKAGVVDAITTADDPYLEPFKTAIDAGVPFVMVSLATYDQIDPAHLAVFSHTIIGDLLRGQLGFRGVVISDALGAKAVTSIPPATRALSFLDAGGDMIISNQVPAAIEMAQAIASRAAAEPAFAQRVDDAALHVLQAKEALGLLPCHG
jgi:beta-N-acetylhexosaminidase